MNSARLIPLGNCVVAQFKGGVPNAKLPLMPTPTGVRNETDAPFLRVKEPCKSLLLSIGSTGDMMAGTSSMEATQPVTAPSVRKTVTSAPLEFCSAKVVRGVVAKFSSLRSTILYQVAE